MGQEDKENVIGFYNDIVKLPSMPEAKELTYKELDMFKNTMWFATWMLSKKYNKCVSQLKDTIKSIVI